MWWLLLSLIWWCGTSAVPAPGVEKWKCPEISEQPVVECSCDMPHTLRCTGDRNAMKIIGAFVIYRLDYNLKFFLSVNRASAAIIRRRSRIPLGLYSTKRKFTSRSSPRRGGPPRSSHILRRNQRNTQLGF